MLDKLRRRYGTRLGEFHGHELYAFPTLDELERATEQELRDMGFGYRCAELRPNREGRWHASRPGKSFILLLFSSPLLRRRAAFIVATVAQLQKLGGREALVKLRQAPLEEVRAVLTSLTGVGPKVADCVALFSLDQRGSIPVDTHVWQVRFACLEREWGGLRSRGSGTAAGDAQRS